jgi:hypothetical protein
MKKIIYVLLGISIIFAACKKEEENNDPINNTPTNQYHPINPNALTYVPDDTFESYLVNNGIGNGTSNDNYVFTECIDTITDLWIGYRGIYDLTGIEDFTALTKLWCEGNELSTLDVSNNTALIDLNCYYNHISSLNLTQNSALKYLDCSVQNPPGGFPGMITGLNVNQNPALEIVRCYSNSITYLNFSNNPALRVIDCEMNNSLTYLNVKNGNNQNISSIDIWSTPLTCITVDDPTWSTNNWQNIVRLSSGNSVYYSLNCP